jgi:sodium transport system permease protein
MNAVFIKEMLDNFRDRRVILNTLVLGPLLGPVIFAVMISFMTRQATERMEAPLELPVVGAEHAPNLIGYLERQGVVIKQAPADPGTGHAHRGRGSHPAHRPDFAEAWLEGRPAPLELIADQSLRYSRHQHRAGARLSQRLCQPDQPASTADCAGSIPS